MNDTLTVERDGELALLTLTRANALNVAGKHAIADALDELHDDVGVRALIVAAGHPGAFLVDVAELADFDHEQARAFSAAGHRVADALGALPFPTIAAVSGPALGGGCELVLACDLAYASDTAELGQIEVKGGVIPGFGGTWRLPRRVGPLRAAEMMFTAAVLPAAQAKEIGLVLDVVPADQLLDHCRAVAAAIATNSRQAVAAAKRVMAGAAGAFPDDARALEQDAFAALFGPEQHARMHAFLAQQA